MFSNISSRLRYYKRNYNIAIYSVSVINGNAMHMQLSRKQTNQNYIGLFPFSKQIPKIYISIEN